MEYVFLTKLKGDWLLVSRDINESRRKNQIKKNRSTRVEKLIMKNPTIRDKYP